MVSVARLVVTPPEVIPGQPGNHTLTTGQNITLHCELTVTDVATPRTVSWFK